MYDAVDAIDQTHAPYLGGTLAPRHASVPAAAEAAAHDTPGGLYPALKGMLDACLQESLAQVPNGGAKRQGIAVGEAVAQRILALRTDDGSNANSAAATEAGLSRMYAGSTPAWITTQASSWAATWPATCSAMTYRLAEHTISAARRPRHDSRRGATWRAAAGRLTAHAQAERWEVR
jgi:hypothetical protein